jgi:hypothetical protein
MKKRENGDPDKIKKLLAYMDFATKLKIAQEDKKRKERNINKKLDK